VIAIAVLVLILFSLACNLTGQIAEEVGEQIGGAIEDQFQEVIETVESQDLFEDLEGITDQFPGENINDLLENFAGGEWTRADVPLPPDAEVFAASVGETTTDSVLFETSMSVEEAEAWLLSELKANGWTQGEMQIVMGQSRVHDFSKGDEGLSLVMNGSPSGGTNVSITIFPQE
jgi:hypothetical protein